MRNEETDVLIDSHNCKLGETTEARDSAPWLAISHAFFTVEWPAKEGVGKALGIFQISEGAMQGQLPKLLTIPGTANRSHGTWSLQSGKKQFFCFRLQKLIKTFRA